MTTSSAHVREQLVRTAEHCYYSGETAGQMWLHDLSAYLQGLSGDDPRFESLAGDEQTLGSAEEVLCSAPQALAQSFSPAAWLDGFAARATPR